MNLRQLSKDDFQEARETIDGLVHRTPLLSSRSLGERCGGLEVWLKTENLQKTGSFKPRGAFNKVRHLRAAERKRGIVTASAGNHGQAVAYIAAHEGIPGTVVMPESANRSKVAAVKEYGAEAVLHGQVWDDAYERSLEIAQERGLTYVHPFHDPYIMAGQGSVALEIIEDLPDVEAVLVGIGGGGLIAGMAMALRLFKPDVRIIGVEPTGSPNMFDSRAAGEAVELDVVATIADGLSTKKTAPEVFALLDPLVDEFVTVSDEEILDGVRFLLERAKLLAEPAGAATTAALLHGKVSLPAGTRTAVVVSGGNFDVEGRLELRY
jgi:threonine dehydratase